MCVCVCVCVWGGVWVTVCVWVGVWVSECVCGCVWVCGCVGVWVWVCLKGGRAGERDTQVTERMKLTSQHQYITHERRAGVCATVHTTPQNATVSGTDVHTTHAHTRAHTPSHTLTRAYTRTLPHTFTLGALTFTAHMHVS